MKNLHFRIGMVVVLSVLINISCWAQQAQQIQLLDQESLKPVTDLAYSYGDKKGISDQNGVIAIVYSAKETLYLSHLNYGSLSYRPEEVRELLAAGKVYIVQQVVNLQPVNVIALHSQVDQQKMAIEGKDILTHDAASILTSMPEIAVIKKSGNYGFDPVFRGFKDEQLNIVIDGSQTAIAACPNRMDPPASQIAPNMMDQVEILKGPHNLRYGTNLGGTINFLTSKDQYEATGRVFGRVSSAYETNGDIFRTEGMIGHLGARHNAKLYGSWSQGNSYTDGNGNLIASSFRRGSFGTKLGYKVTQNQELALSVNGNFARDVEFASLMMDLRSDDTWLVKLDHKIEFKNQHLEHWTTNLYSSLVNHVMDNLEKPLDPRMVNAITDATTTTIGGRTEGYLNFTNNVLYVGADYKFETARGERSREFLMGPNAGNTMYDNVWQDGQIAKIGLFAELTKSYNDFRFVASARLESNNAKLDDPQAEFTNEYSSTVSNQFNTSISLGAVRNWQRFSSGIWLARAQRSGSITERYINYFPVGVDPYEMLGNPDLKAETNYEADVNLKYQAEKTSVKLEGFVSLLPDFISSTIRTDLNPRIPSSPGVRQFINLDKALLTGIEFSWSQVIIAGLSHQLNLAYVQGQDMVKDEPLPEIAPFDIRYQLRGSYFNDKLVALAKYRFVAEQNRISTEFGESASPSFSLIDLELGYQFNPVFGLNLAVNNLFDTAYYEHLNRPITSSPPGVIYAPGRNMSLTLVVNFD